MSTTENSAGDWTENLDRELNLRFMVAFLDGKRIKEGETLAIIRKHAPAVAKSAHVDERSIGKASEKYIQAWLDGRNFYFPKSKDDLREVMDHAFCFGYRASGATTDEALRAADELAKAIQEWQEDPQKRDPDAFNVWVALKDYRQVRAASTQHKQEVTLAEVKAWITDTMESDTPDLIEALEIITTAEAEIRRQRGEENL